MRISDWSSDVCSSDLPVPQVVHELQGRCRCPVANLIGQDHLAVAVQGRPRPYVAGALRGSLGALYVLGLGVAERPDFIALHPLGRNLANGLRSEEHTSELQSLMRLSYAVFCLKKKNKN